MENWSKVPIFDTSNYNKVGRQKQNKMKTLQQKAAEIKEKYNAIPEKQVSAGIYIHTIGRKYVTLLNTWGKTTLEKVEINEFYENHM